MRDVVEPTIDEDGDESHPAWAVIGASRVQGGPGVLFDSDIKHHHYVTVRLSRATRKRDLNRDWIHGDMRQIIEVAMSEAQWAAFVSSMNTGGVPCTLTYEEGKGLIPGMPFAPRLQHSVDEVRNAARTAMAKVKEKFEAVREKPNKGNIRSLGFALESVEANMGFAAESLNEHVENVVTKAKADIEAYVADKAAQLGLEPGDLGFTLELESGEPVEDAEVVSE